MPASVIWVRSRAGNFLAAEPIKHQMHFDAGTGALAQSSGEFLAGCSGPIDVRFKGYGVPGGANCFQHGGKNFIAVLQRRDLVALEDGRTKQRAHFALELRIYDSIKMANLVLYLLFGRTQINDQHDDGKRRHYRPGDYPHLRYLRRRQANARPVGAERPLGRRGAVRLVAARCQNFDGCVHHHVPCVAAAIASTAVAGFFLV